MENEQGLETQLIPLLEKALTGRSIKSYNVSKTGSVTVHLTGTPAVSLTIAGIQEGEDEIGDAANIN